MIKNARVIVTNLGVIEFQRRFVIANTVVYEVFSWVLWELPWRPLDMGVE